MDRATEIARIVDLFDTRDDLERTPLLAELRAAGAIEAVPELSRSADPAQRWLAARVGELLPDPSLVRLLAALVRDPDPATERAARRALHQQLRTSEWRAEVEALAAAGDADAAAWLAER